MPAQLSTRPPPPNPFDYNSEGRFRCDYEAYRQAYGGPRIDGTYSREQIAKIIGRSSADYYRDMLCPPIVMDVMTASEIMQRKIEKDMLLGPSKAPCMNRKLLLTKR